MIFVIIDIWFFGRFSRIYFNGDTKMSEVRDEMAEKSPIFVLPEDKARVEQLQKKLEEYKGRFNPYGAPESQMDTICKTTVLKRLLRDSVVDTFQLYLEMKETYGSGFDAHKFNVACGVIDNYCKMGGEGIIGGTGLPNLDAPNLDDRELDV